MGDHIDMQSQWSSSLAASSNLMDMIELLLDEDNESEDGDTSTMYHGEVTSGERKKSVEEMKEIYVSFYTPDNMVYQVPASASSSSSNPDPHQEDGEEHFFIKVRQIKNTMGLLASIFFFCTHFFHWFTQTTMDCIIKKSHEITVSSTHEADFPLYNYSHTEISTQSHTYVVKWGCTIQKKKGRFISPDQYGTVCITLKASDYALVQQECERAVEKNMSFNYIGSVVNFVGPLWLRKLFFRNSGGVYQDDNKCFCSEFISRALIHTSAFGKLYREENLSPSQVSPIKLYILIYKYSQKRPARVRHSIHNIKRRDPKFIAYGK